MATTPAQNLSSLVEDAKTLIDPNLTLLDLEVAFAQRTNTAPPGFFIDSRETVKKYEERKVFSNQAEMQKLLQDKKDLPDNQKLIDNILLANIVDKIQTANPVNPLSELSKSEIDFLLQSKEANVQKFVDRHKTEITQALASHKIAPSPGGKVL
jgi:hypothetical protein